MQWSTLPLEASLETLFASRDPFAKLGMASSEIVRTPTEPPERTDGGEAVALDLIVVSCRRNARRLSVKEVGVRELAIRSNYTKTNDSRVEED